MDKRSKTLMMILEGSKADMKKDKKMPNEKSKKDKKQDKNRKNKNSNKDRIFI